MTAAFAAKFTGSMLLTAEGLGTSAIMRETAKFKTCVWRW
jgi:hypothetical protein